MTSHGAAVANPGVISRSYWTAFTLLRIPAAWRFPFAALALIEAVQNRRVRAMVAHAHATVPYYRDAMRERGLSPGDFETAADLAKLPLVRGDELAREPRRFLSDAVADLPLLEVTTSGSSGHAKQIWWDRAAVFDSRATGVRQRQVRAALLGRWLSVKQLTVGPIAGTAATVAHFYNAHSWFPGVVLTRTERADPRENFERNLAAINSAKPDVVAGFGAYIAAIYRWAHAQQREIHRPRLIRYGGEHMPEADRKFLEAEFGIPINSSYQACEAFRIAQQCERNAGFHIHADQVALRVVDEGGATLPPGQSGRIVLSNLTNRATVLLNYVLGDRGSLADEACPCGRKLPMLASLEGRNDDLVVLPDGERLHDSTLLPRLYAVPGVIRVQVIQETLGDFRIRVVHVGELPDALLCERLADALKQAIGPHFRTARVEIVEEIPAGAGGKFRCVISRVVVGPTGQRGGSAGFSASAAASP